MSLCPIICFNLLTFSLTVTKTTTADGPHNLVAKKIRRLCVEYEKSNEPWQRQGHRPLRTNASSGKRNANKGVPLTSTIFLFFDDERNLMDIFSQY